MNTRRCELCGTLHGTEGGSVSISVPRADVEHCTYDHYNLCEVCALKVYDSVEKLKASDGKMLEEPSAQNKLIMRQNAEIAKMRMCIRRANTDLHRGMKYTGKNSANAAQEVSDAIDSAMNWLGAAEHYEND